MVAEQQLLRGVQARIETPLLDSDGDPASGLTVTVSVARADGTALLTDVTTTENTASSGTFTITGSYYTEALTAANLESLDLLTATWKVSTVVRAVTYHEIVGGYYFTTQELKEREPNVRDAADSDLRTARRETEEEFEKICDVAFVPRYKRIRVDGTGSSKLFLPVRRPRTIRTVRVYSTDTAYTSLTSGECAAIVCEPSGLIYRSDGGVFEYGSQNLVLELEHGHDRPPAEVKRAAMRRTRMRYAMGNASIDRALQLVQEGNIVRIAQPGALLTGDPDVDAVLQRPGINMRVPAIA